VTTLTRVKPFLLLATRAEDAAADNEYEAFLTYSGLCRDQLVRHRLERHPLGEVDLDRLSGILLGGSPFNGTDPDEVKSDVQHRVEADLQRLLDTVVPADFPLLGACYGIGTVGVHEGATLDRRYAEPVGAVRITLTDQGRADPLLEGMPDSFDAFVGHKEAISTLPDHAVLLASSPTCPVQLFRVGRNVYATQFHPELDIEGLCTRVEIYKHAGYFPPDQAEQVKAMARRSTVVHPPELLRAFVSRYGDGSRGASALPAENASLAS
jgi:GMP synthase (glutamine-hydrolysing)